MEANKHLTPNDRFCGIVSVDQSPGNGRSWPVPVFADHGNNQ